MKTHIIHWVSSVTGGIGTGKKLFEKEDAELLAAELNSSYPDIDHEAVPAEPESAPPQVVAVMGGSGSRSGDGE
jgi:hypothetical protein